ncbi:MAG TPA: hypothetical protein DCR17_05350 [Verrucomicrobiales bacterium]|nr:hypothetical protein [Verrucomicrobiales bacterium]HCP36847.1 hypothetical protein [Verrucomicrobiales bacterium]
MKRPIASPDDKQAKPYAIINERIREQFTMQRVGMKCWRCSRITILKFFARNLALTCDYILTGKQASLASGMGYAPQ